jgi:hypothetical protein
MLTGCAADTTTLDTTDQGPAPAEQAGAAGTETMETTAAAEAVEGMESTGEAQEGLTQWQKICVLGCSTLAGAGCASVSMSCTAGTLWSFGGILIPCVYAVVAACAGAASVTTVCAIECVGG